MTLIITINGPETIWVMADRGLTKGGRVVKDDACKIMALSTRDGEALLGYAGLGATERHLTEPSDWMSATLRNRNLSLEQSLQVIAETAKRELPYHLGGALPHAILAPAFLNGAPKMYTIELKGAPDRRSVAYFRFTHHVYDKHRNGFTRATPLACAGSGIKPLLNDRSWVGPLLKLVHACDREIVSPIDVADRLAAINSRIHLLEPTVGKRCIVAWRNKDGARRGGGAQMFYHGAEREKGNQDRALPSIGSGMDLAALANALMQYFVPMAGEVMAASREGRQPPELDREKINASLAKLRVDPDDRLR